MDKNIIKETMLSLEGAALQSACEKYFDYVADARLDRSEPIEGLGLAVDVRRHTNPLPWRRASGMETITPLHFQWLACRHTFCV